MPSSDNSLIKIGIITSAHGVKGQVKIRSYSDVPEDILAHKALSDASGKRSFRLKKQGVQKNILIASIEGIPDRNAAELLKGTELYAPAPDKKIRRPRQWTYGELTGLAALLSNGKPYGKVIGVYNFGAGDIIEIELVAGNTEMLPFTEAFTGNVDLDKGTITVMPPEYVEAKE